MYETDIATVKRKTVAGILALTTRTFLMQLMSMAGMLVLAIYLDPTVFGIYAIVTSLISFLNYFSDIGLAAALIQKKDHLSDQDLVSSFTLQQLLIGSLVTVSLIFSGQLGAFFGFDPDGVWLFRALLVSFFLSSLKTIPSILLERDLNFQRLVIPQLVETLLFNAVAASAAVMGWGIWSFTWAVLVRGVSGLVVIWIIRPWRIRLGIDRSTIRGLLTYGVPFQANSLLALVKDDLLTLFLGKALPLGQVGYIGWAKKWSELPLRLIMDSIIRVTFPAFSRLQHRPQELGRAIERLVYATALIIFPITALMIVHIHGLVLTIPRFGKWEPAVFSYTVFAMTSVLASISTPLTNALNAIGRIKTTLVLMVFWTVLTWITTTVAIAFFGYNGVSVAFLIVALTAPLTLVAIRQHIPVTIIPTLFIPFLGAITLLITAWFARFVLPVSIPSIAAQSVMGGILYGAVVWQLDRVRIRTTLADLKGVLPWHR